MQTETQAGNTSTPPNQDTVVIVRHVALESKDLSVWKPMYKRLRGMAKLKGHPHSLGLPGRGWCHFDGKKFRTDTAYVAFKFSDWQEHNRFIDRIRTIEGVRVRVRGLSAEWYHVCGEIW